MLARDFEQTESTATTPELIVHCDWSLSPRKRWCATARRSSDGEYHVDPPLLVGTLDSFFERLRAETRAGSIFVGFDFPIGVPRLYAERAGISRFPDLLLELGERRWAEFYTPAEKPDQISLTRPFYPLTPGGTSKQHLYDGLGLTSARS